jgi:hypothetical protein
VAGVAESRPKMCNNRVGLPHRQPPDTYHLFLRLFFQLVKIEKVIWENDFIFSTNGFGRFFGLERDRD